MDWLSNLFVTLREAVTSRHTSSAMKPFFWLIGIAALCLFLSFRAETGSDASARFFWLGAAVLAAYIVAYFYFAIRAPDRLHSETYLLGQRRLDLLEAKGMRSPISPTAIEILANPDPSLKPEPEDPETAPQLPEPILIPVEIGSKSKVPQ